MTEHRMIGLPKPSGWEVRIAGEYGICIRPDDRANIPCWFHRLMQRLVVGIVWEKIKNEE